VKVAEEKRARDEAALIKKTWPGARPSPKGALFLVRRKGSGVAAAPGSVLRVRYTVRQLDGRQMASSADEGRPVPGAVAEPFDYVVGKTRITPALDEALLEMRPGERRTIIAQGTQAYGRNAYYSREKPGEKRFVIAPGTTLVYDVEILAATRK
jgi:FKBP-type peptidyl-prolyl cis-trans isomerase